MSHGSDLSAAAPSPSGSPAAEQWRVLVVEDEFLLGMQLEEELREEGHDVVGPYGHLGDATHAAQSERFDVAVLDVNLNGQLIYPLADELQARGVPFVLLSGYGAANLPDRFKSTPRVMKPYDTAMLFREIRRAMRRG